MGHILYYRGAIHLDSPCMYSVYIRVFPNDFLQNETNPCRVFDIVFFRKGQVSKGKGDDGAPFQNGDMKKKPLEYDELSIPFIDASPAPTPKVGRSTER